MPKNLNKIECKLNFGLKITPNANKNVILKCPSNVIKTYQILNNTCAYTALLESVDDQTPCSNVAWKRKGKYCKPKTLRKAFPWNNLSHFNDSFHKIYYVRCWQGHIDESRTFAKMTIQIQHSFLMCIRIFYELLYIIIIKYCV